MTDEEFERVHEAAGDGRSAAALQAKILRLRGLAEAIEDPRERENAGHDIALLDDLLTHDDDLPLTAARVEANAAYQAATTSLEASGSVR
jgi:hypothetical protein